MINTLTHRAKAVCSNSELLKTEFKYLQEVLCQCKYPNWAIDKVKKTKKTKKTGIEENKAETTISQTNKRRHIVVPYSQGLCKSYKNICGRYGVQVTFQRRENLEKSVDVPKGQRCYNKQSNIIYWFKCGRTESDEEYIGESTRTFEQRYKEHLKAHHLFVNIKTLLAIKHQWRISKS